MSLDRSRTFLALCQDAVSDLGITGGVIQSVTGNSSQELVRIVNWVARADLLIQNLWSDWNFLWTTDALTIASGADSFQTVKKFNDIDHLSLVLNPDLPGVSPFYPTWVEWDTFRVRWQNRVKTASPRPSNWTVDPAGKVWLSHYTTAATPAQISYWAAPVRMVNNNDTSPIPGIFDTIIVERAKIIYAQRENAVEILVGSTAEFTDQLDKLESSCLPAGRAARKSRNDRTTNHDGYVE